MGFRQNSYMTCWSTEPSKTGKTTRVRLSSSRKNKETNEYETDFSGYCTFIGNAHKNASMLKERDRIKILECDVCTNYNKEKKTEYVNYKVFDFEMADGGAPVKGGGQNKASSGKTSAGKRTAFDEEGDIDDVDPY